MIIVTGLFVGLSQQFIMTDFMKCLAKRSCITHALDLYLKSQLHAVGIEYIFRDRKYEQCHGCLKILTPVAVEPRRQTYIQKYDPCTVISRNLFSIFA